MKRSMEESNTSLNIEQGCSNMEGVTAPQFVCSRALLVEVDNERRSYSVDPMS